MRWNVRTEWLIFIIILIDINKSIYHINQLNFNAIILLKFILQIFWWIYFQKYKLNFTSNNRCKKTWPIPTQIWKSTSTMPKHSFHHNHLKTRSSGNRKPKIKLNSLKSITHSQLENIWNSPKIPFITMNHIANVSEEDFLWQHQKKEERNSHNKKINSQREIRVATRSRSICSGNN